MGGRGCRTLDRAGEDQGNGEEENQAQQVTFRAMLESGMGVSLVAEIGSLSRSPDLLFKPLKETGEDLTLELLALWVRGQASPMVANFIAEIGRVLPLG